MDRATRTIKFALAALALAMPALAQEEETGRLFAQLATPEWEAAERRLEALMQRSGSAAVDYLFRRGEEALEAERYGVAVEHLSAAIDHAPGFAEAYHARATAFYRLKRAGLAMEDLQRVLAIEPRHWGALTGVGVIMNDLGYKEEALSAYMAARSIHPNLEEVNEAIDRLIEETTGSTL